MFATFRKIKKDKHAFRAQEKGKVYIGTVNSVPSDRGTTLASVDSYPDLSKEQEGYLMNSFVKYRKNV